MTAELTLKEACTLYTEHLQAQGKNPRTLYTYGRDLAQIQAFFGPDEPLSVLTLPRVGKFLRSDELLRLPNGQDRAQPTVKKTIRVFRCLVLWLKAQGHIDLVPLPKGVPLGRNQAPEV
jgi:hypothetical protein